MIDLITQEFLQKDLNDQLWKTDLVASSKIEDFLHFYRAPTSKQPLFDIEAGLAYTEFKFIQRERPMKYIEFRGAQARIF